MAPPLGNLRKFAEISGSHRASQLLLPAKHGGGVSPPPRCVRGIAAKDPLWSIAPDNPCYRSKKEQFPLNFSGQSNVISPAYSFMPANAALRCQSNKADRSSWADDDGAVGADL